MTANRRGHPTLEYRLASVARPAGNMSAAKQQPFVHFQLPLSVHERRLLLMASMEFALQMKHNHY